MKNIDIKSFPSALLKSLVGLKKYSVLAFVLLLFVIYGYITYRIHAVSTQAPATAAIDNQIKGSHVPQVDPEIVRKLESLNDNSASVQALFNEARSNPFQ
jgi:hypothetical protein